jgi:hypothetical protein
MALPQVAEKLGIYANEDARMHGSGGARSLERGEPRDYGDELNLGATTATMQ